MLKKQKKYGLACSVYKGIIREVFLVKKWLPSSKHTDRWMFQGSIAPKKIREQYLHKSIARYWKKGTQSPVRYIQPSLR